MGYPKREGPGDLTTLYLRRVPAALVREAKAVAARRGSTLTALVIEALSQAIGPPARRAHELPEELRTDAAWYEEHKEELLERYPGRYVAIKNQRIIDQDADFGALARRVFSAAGPRPVLMPRCVADERVIEIPSPRVARG